MAYPISPEVVAAWKELKCPKHVWDEFMKEFEMTEEHAELDWSDVSKLQTRSGMQIIAVYDRYNDQKLIVYKDEISITESAVIYSDGREYEDEENDCDVIPFQPIPASLDAWIFNPWTGEKRDHRDIARDPFGKGMVAPGVEWKAASADVIPRPPQTTRKKGWIALYTPPKVSKAIAHAFHVVYQSEEDCRNSTGGAHRIACVPVEWEEVGTSSGEEDAPKEEKKPKTVTLWRPSYFMNRYASGGIGVTDSLEWREEGYWASHKDYGPLESREFEVGDE